VPPRARRARDHVWTDLLTTSTTTRPRLPVEDVPGDRAALRLRRLPARPVRGGSVVNVLTSLWQVFASRPSGAALETCASAPLLLTAVAPNGYRGARQDDKYGRPYWMHHQAEARLSARTTPASTSAAGASTSPRRRERQLAALHALARPFENVAERSSWRRRRPASARPYSTSRPTSRHVRAGEFAKELGMPIIMHDFLTADSRPTRLANWCRATACCSHHRAARGHRPHPYHASTSGLVKCSGCPVVTNAFGTVVGKLEATARRRSAGST